MKIVFGKWMHFHLPTPQLSGNPLTILQLCGAFKYLFTFQLPKRLREDQVAILTKGFFQMALKISQTKPTIFSSWLSHPPKNVLPTPTQPIQPSKNNSGTNLLRLPSPYIFHYFPFLRQISTTLTTQQRYTGGTIGMMKGPDGSLRPEPGELQRRLTKIEELNQAVDGRMFGGISMVVVFSIKSQTSSWNVEWNATTCGV